jgi:hypothetical protein
VLLGVVLFQHGRFTAGRQVLHNAFEDAHVALLYYSFLHHIHPKDM